MTVYVDLVVILNFLVDLLLLMGTNRLAGFPLGIRRCILGAMIGAVYSGACLIPGFRFLGNPLWRGVSLGLICGAAFGWNRSAWKRGGVFVMLSMALGGLALSLGRGDFPDLVLSAAGMWLLCRVAFGQGVGGREYVPLTISYGGKTVSLIALWDTGNTLRDPVSGEGVFVLSGEAAQRLTGLTEGQLRDPLKTIAQRPIPGLRLIPYRTVGQGSGMLLAMRLSEVKVDGRRQEAVVAFSPEGLAGACQALVTV